LSHVVVRSPVQLTLPYGHTKVNLYEWSGGHLQPVSVFPKGEENGEGDAELAGAMQSGVIDTEKQGTRRAISEDGQRVIWVKVGEDAPAGIYLRDVAKGETVRFAGASSYMTASKDASRVYFLSGIGVGDLEVFEITSGPGEPLAGKTVDLTVDPHAGESAGVVAVLGASDDGSYVYFAAHGALTPDAVPAVPGECEHVFGLENSEGCNVYVRHAGVTRLVAAGWMEGSAFASRWSRVSPDGRWLAFMSRKSLTGYDTRDAVTGQPDAEVYLYDANTGRLVCASCNPTGARPVGAQDATGSLRVAANVPGWTNSGPFGQTRYQSRYLSNSGRLFFESNDALVPQDVNGARDVYEYEPEGAPASEHACAASSTSGSEVFKPARAVEVEGRKVQEDAGCVALVSSGTSSEESSFLDASESGGDVFLLTTSKLTPQDFDNAADVYDAHECTMRSPCIPPPPATPPPCITEAACKPSPTPQPSIFGLPASATFAGSGNATPPPPVVTKKTIKCPRGKKLSHGKCIKAKAKRKKKAHKAKRATNDRRASR
jgi:hypothetical protein